MNEQIIIIFALLLIFGLLFVYHKCKKHRNVKEGMDFNLPGSDWTDSMPLDLTPQPYNNQLIPGSDWVTPSDAMQSDWTFSDTPIPINLNVPDIQPQWGDLTTPPDTTDNDLDWIEAAGSGIDSAILESSIAYFPNAYPENDIYNKVLAVLNPLGISENTLFAHSSCSDEIIHMPGKLLNQFMDYFGSAFKMGGLGGINFGGQTSFNAFASHASDVSGGVTNGNLFIIYGPHVGISDTGVIGLVNRPNQNHESTCCGALIGGHGVACPRNKQFQDDIEMQYDKGLTMGKLDKLDVISIMREHEFEYIISSLRASGICNKNYTDNQKLNAELASTYFYPVVEKSIMNSINWNLRYNKLVLLGGVFINISSGDYFQPKTFKIYERNSGSNMQETNLLNNLLNNSIDNVSLHKDYTYGGLELPSPQPVDMSQYNISLDIIPVNYSNLGSIPDSFYTNLNTLRNTFISSLSAGDHSRVLANYPVYASKNLRLLGSYVINTPMCKWLEKVPNSSDQLQIKLDGNSFYQELNDLSSIVRDGVKYQNIILIFDIDRTRPYDFLILSGVKKDVVVISLSEPIYINCLQSFFSEISLCMTILHGIWHIQTANIIYKVNTELAFTEILKVFNMASYNVYVKLEEVRAAVFDTTLIFNQILNLNPKFYSFCDKYIANFDANFNIDTIFDTYFNTRLHYPELNWVSGMKDNINIIKQFTEKIFVKYKELYKPPIIPPIYNLMKDIPQMTKLLQQLLVVSTAFHSTTTEFTKLVFTDVINYPFMNSISYGILFSTITPDFTVIFGDIVNYKGTDYRLEFNWLYLYIDELRTRTYNQIQNSTFTNNPFTTRDNMSLSNTTNSYTTYF